MFTVDLAPEAKRKRASRKCRGQKKRAAGRQDRTSVTDHTTFLHCFIFCSYKMNCITTTDSSCVTTD